MVNEHDEVYLAEIYSNIMYNAQGKEATAELLKNAVLLNKSDYANYIAALGLFKTGESEQAETYINNAIKINPDNINYQKLKIEISLMNDKNSDAVKILSNIKKVKFYTSYYKDKISILEEYIAYKTEKNDTLKKYHLGYYYHNLGEDVKAARTLQGAISNKKKYNRSVYGLLADVYYSQKEYEKAYNFADKSIQLGGNNPKARMVLGKIAYRKQDYKTALKQFKSVNSSIDSSASLWIAMIYSAMGDEKQARDIYYKILKDRSDCSEAYYSVANNEKEREQEYYKKSVTANLNYKDGWVGLAKYAIEHNNLASAGKYLEIVKYIDENDFRYYYYQGLLLKAKGYHQDAKYYFRRSLVINPDNNPAKKELGI
jgi:tetratricopeptide (TPR) repeat protein